jgi:hypothetical protein
MICLIFENKYDVTRPSFVYSYPSGPKLIFEELVGDVICLKVQIFPEVKGQLHVDLLWEGPPPVMKAGP